MKGFIGAVAYELSPYFGPMRPMSLDHAGLSVKDRVLLDADAVTLTRI